MKFKPLHDWILIQQDSTEEKSKGGIYFPESAKEKTQTGEVIAVGEGKLEEEEDKKGKSRDKKERKFIKTVVKPGQQVFFEKYGSTQVEIEGKELLLVRERDVLGYTE